MKMRRSEGGRESLYSEGWIERRGRPENKLPRWSGGVDGGVRWLETTSPACLHVSLAAAWRSPLESLAPASALLLSSSSSTQLFSPHSETYSYLPGTQHRPQSRWPHGAQPPATSLPQPSNTRRSPSAELSHRHQDAESTQLASPWPSHHHALSTDFSFRPHSVYFSVPLVGPGTAVPW